MNIQNTMSSPQVQSIENVSHCVFKSNKLSLHNPGNCSDFCQFPWYQLIVEILGQVGDAAAAAKSLQSCPTLCDPIDGSPPGPTVPGILQARTLEWVAISSSNAWKWKVKVKSPSPVWLLATPRTAAYQAPPSIPKGISGVGKETTEILTPEPHSKRRKKIKNPLPDFTRTNSRLSNVGIWGWHGVFPGLRHRST